MGEWGETIDLLHKWAENKWQWSNPVFLSLFPIPYSLFPDFCKKSNDSGTFHARTQKPGFLLSCRLSPQPK